MEKLGFNANGQWTLMKAGPELRGVNQQYGDIRRGYKPQDPTAFAVLNAHHQRANNTDTHPAAHAHEHTAISYPNFEDYAGHHQDLFHHVQPLELVSPEHRGKTAFDVPQNSIDPQLDRLAVTAHQLNTGSDKTHVDRLNAWKAKIGGPKDIAARGHSPWVESEFKPAIGEASTQPNVYGREIRQEMRDVASGDPRTSRGFAANLNSAHEKVGAYRVDPNDPATHTTPAHEHQHFVDQHLDNKYGQHFRYAIRNLALAQLPKEIVKTIFQKVQHYKSKQAQLNEILPRAIELANNPDHPWYPTLNPQQHAELKKALSDIRQQAQTLKPSDFIRGGLHHNFLRSAIRQDQEYLMDGKMFTPKPKAASK